MKEMWGISMSHVIKTKLLKQYVILLLYIQYKDSILHIKT